MSNFMSYIKGLFTAKVVILQGSKASEYNPAQLKLCRDIINALKEEYGVYRIMSSDISNDEVRTELNGVRRFSSFLDTLAKNEGGK